MSGGLECEIRVDEARLKKVPEFITIWGALDESDKYVGSLVEVFRGGL